MKIIRTAKISPLGDSALTLEFGNTIDRDLSRRVMAARHAIDAAGLPGVRETVPTFRALAVHFDPDATGHDELVERLAGIDIPERPGAGEGRTHRVPVLYDGPDLEEVACHAGVTAPEAAALHASSPYHVYMLGFLPGFAYLGDLPTALRLPRLGEPRTRVPAGSVAIADQLSAVYPVDSPGGWRLIGRTPLRLFDRRRDPPNLFAAGDHIEFVAVDQAEFERLAHEAQP